MLRLEIFGGEEGGRERRKVGWLVPSYYDRVLAFLLRPTLRHWQQLFFGKLAEIWRPGYSGKRYPCIMAPIIYYNRSGCPSQVWASGSWVTIIWKDPGQGSKWSLMKMDIYLVGLGLHGHHSVERHHENHHSHPSQHRRAQALRKNRWQLSLSKQKKALALTQSNVNYILKADPTKQEWCQLFIPFTQR